MAQNESVSVWVTVQQEASVSTYALGMAVMSCVHARIGPMDDPGVDWFTDKAGCTFLDENPEWCVSTNPCTGALVDAANVLKHGKLLKMPDLAEARPADLEAALRGAGLEKAKE